MFVEDRNPVGHQRDSEALEEVTDFDDFKKKCRFVKIKNARSFR